MIKPRNRKIIFFAVIAAIVFALIIATSSSFLTVFLNSCLVALVLGGIVALALLVTAFIFWAFDESSEDCTYNEVFKKMIDEIKTSFE